MTTKNLDKTKMKAIVHYICDKAKDPACLGAIKLNKVLWYSDSIAFLSHGQSITHETYVKRQFGPVPKHIVAIREELQSENKIRRGRANYFEHIKDEYISLDKPDLTSLSIEDLSIIDAAFLHVCMEHTAMSVSDETHDDIWKLAEIGEQIPMETIFASQLAELDENDIAWARADLAANAT